MIEAWNTILLEPMLNGLVLFSNGLFGSFGLAIFALTIVVRILILPLTRRQLRSTKAMQTLAPKLQELQKKYAKERQKLADEQMKLYKEHGVNPMGCLVPMLIQLPIWIALYQSIIQALAVSPEALYALSQRLYNSPAIWSAVPLESTFLGLNLGQPNFFLAIIVAFSMWLLQKMSTPSGTEGSQPQMARTMTFMMPLMFGFIALSFPSGLALYWVASTVISMVMQYFVTGWGSLEFPTFGRRPAEEPSVKKLPTPEVSVESEGQEEGIINGQPTIKRKDRRRSGRGGSR